MAMICDESSLGTVLDYIVVQERTREIADYVDFASFNEKEATREQVETMGMAMEDIAAWHSDFSQVRQIRKLIYWLMFIFVNVEAQADQLKFPRLGILVCVNLI